MSPVRAPILPQKLAYRIDEAAMALGLSRSRIYELIRDGELELGKLAGRSVIPREAVEAFYSRSYKPVTARRGVG